MPKFTDNKNRTWSVDVTVATVKRVRQALNVDLSAIFENDATLLRQLTTDPVLMCDVIYVVCQPQADAASPKVSSEEFGEALAGDAVTKAVEALIGALVDFFPKDRGAVLKKVVSKASEVQAKAAELALAAIDSPEVEKHLQALLGSLSGPTPGSSESTPAPSR